jgi:hypothetical protein
MKKTYRKKRVINKETLKKRIYKTVGGSAVLDEVSLSISSSISGIKDSLVPYDTLYSYGGIIAQGAMNKIVSKATAQNIGGLIVGLAAIGGAASLVGKGGKTIFNKISKTETIDKLLETAILKKTNRDDIVNGLEKLTGNANEALRTYQNKKCGPIKVIAEDLKKNYTKLEEMLNCK